MDFLKEWEEKLNIKITCSQVGGRPAGACRLFNAAAAAVVRFTAAVAPLPRRLPCMRQQPGDAAVASACMPRSAAAPPARLLRSARAQEPEPMGTAGPLALARDILWNDSNTPFFVLNRWAARAARGGSRCCCWCAACAGAWREAAARPSSCSAGNLGACFR